MGMVLPQKMVGTQVWGVVIRDSNGMTVAACSNYLLGQSTALETEALAVECGILLAREMELAQESLKLMLYQLFKVLLLAKLMEELAICILESSISLILSGAGS